MAKEGSLLYESSDKGKRIVKSAWKGSRAVATVIVGGLALGLGLRAFGAASGD